jgi:hypothetical protein
MCLDPLASKRQTNSSVESVRVRVTFLNRRPEWLQKRKQNLAQGHDRVLLVVSILIIVLPDLDLAQEQQKRVATPKNEKAKRRDHRLDGVVPPHLVRDRDRGHERDAARRNKKARSRNHRHPLGIARPIGLCPNP